MTATTILVLGAITVAFTVLAVVLAWAERQTRGIKTEQPAIASSRRRAF
jgi:hypothetical protein